MVMGPIDTMAREIEETLADGGRPIIHGPSGVGKTRLVEKIAERTGRKLLTLIGSQSEPTDMGLPMKGQGTRIVDADGRDHQMFEMAISRVFADLHNHDRWILFLDELKCVKSGTRASWLRLLTDGAAGNFQLDMNRGAIIAATNSTDDAVDGQDFEPPMVNRLDHFHFPMTTTSALEWCDNLPTYWGNPGYYAPHMDRPANVSVDHLIKARSMVADFVRRFPTLWHPAVEGSKIKTERDDAGWPSPRSLDRSARYLAGALSRGQAPVTCLGRIAAAVGSDVAGDFHQYVSTHDVPDPEAVLANAENWEFSGRPDLDYVVMQSVAAAVLAKPTAERLFAGLKVCERSVTDRSGSPAKEAAYSAMSKLTSIAESGSAGYKAITKGNTQSQNIEFAAKMQQAVRWYHKVLDTARGKR